MVDIRVDFSNAAAVADANWNTINTKTTSDVALVNFATGDTSDGITGALLDVRNRGLAKGTTTNNWQTAVNPGPDWLDGNKNAAKDYVATPSNAMIEFDFKGLDPALTYTIEAISSRNSSSGYDNANVAWRAIGAVTSSTTFNAYQNGYVAGSWLTWADVAPDATGKIAIQVGVPSGTTPNLYLNAIRLYAVPEPATLLLLGLAGLIPLRRR